MHGYYIIWNCRLRCILNDVPSVIPLLEELKYKQLWKPWYVYEACIHTNRYQKFETYFYMMTAYVYVCNRARLYSIFSAQLAPHMPHVKVLSQLFEVEQYELCSEMVIT